MEEQKIEQLPFFFYGSLRVGAARFSVVRPYVESFHPGWLSGYQLYHLGAFPGIIPGSVEKPVVGDIVEVHSETWDVCISVVDRYENNGYLFQRIKLMVIDQFSGMNCWVYVGRTETLHFAGSQVIKSNDWMNRG